MVRSYRERVGSSATTPLNADDEHGRLGNLPGIVVGDAASALRSVPSSGSRVHGNVQLWGFVQDRRMGSDLSCKST